MDVTSLRGIPVLDSRPQLTQEGDLFVSVVDVPTSLRFPACVGVGLRSLWGRSGVHWGVGLSSLGVCLRSIGGSV